MVNLITRMPHRDEFFFPIEQTMNKMLNDFFSEKTFNFAKGSSGYPKLDIQEVDGTLRITAAVPGVAAENLKVEVLPDNVLRITGEMAEEYHTKEGTKDFIRELHKSKFLREIQLPEDLDGEPDAELRNGVLTLNWRLPEAKPKEQAKQIKISTG